MSGGGDFTTQWMAARREDQAEKDRHAALAERQAQAREAQAQRSADAEVLAEERDAERRGKRDCGGDLRLHHHLGKSAERARSDQPTAKARSAQRHIVFSTDRNRVRVTSACK